MKTSTAKILREYGPFENVDAVHGLTFDGQRVWFATGDTLKTLDIGNGLAERSINVPASAGTAFDGKHLFQIANGLIQKIDPTSGSVVASIPAPNSDGSSGLAWAEGSLWVGQYHDRLIHQVDPETGKILRTITTNRYVTGVTWVDGEFWHGTWEDGTSDLRRLDPESGNVLETIEMPSDVAVSGLESNGEDQFFCGGSSSGLIRAIARPD